MQKSPELQDDLFIKPVDPNDPAIVELNRYFAEQKRARAVKDDPSLSLTKRLFGHIDEIVNEIKHTARS